MRHLAYASLAVLVLGLASCGSSQSGQFDCLRNGQCNDHVGGVCESIGFCAYPSSACVSGYQYSSNAGAGLANTCVALPDAGIHDAAPPDRPPPDMQLPDMTPLDSPPPEAPCLAPAPRLLSPLSTSIVTSQRPTLRWTYMPSPSVDAGPGLAGGLVQVCTDHACTSPVTGTGFMAGGMVMATAGNQVTLPQLSAGTYFWHVFGHSTCYGTTASPTWQFRVGYHSASHSDSYGSVPDFNGDGFSDLSMAYFGQATGCTTSNPVDVIMSAGSSGLAGTPLLGSTLCDIDSVSTIGDVDGDGFADVMGANGTGTGCNPAAAYGYGGMPPFSMPHQFSASPTSTGSGTAATAGDVNGDGYADAVWAYGASSSISGVYFGSATGISQGTLGPACNNPIDSLAPLGDIDGDGYADAAAGMEGYNMVQVCKGGAGSHGLAGPVKLSTGNVVYPAGDFNGDGYVDLLVAQCTAPAGSCTHWSYHRTCTDLWVYEGGSFGTFPTSPSFTLACTTSDPSCTTTSTPMALPTGQTIGSAWGVGDINGDGYSDIVVGAPNTSGVGGAAYLYLSNPPGAFPVTPSQVISAPASCTSGSCLFGTQVTLLDINGDNLDDVVVTGDSTGSYVYFSTGSGVSSTPSQMAPYASRLGGNE
jgi:hypothetical protein